MRGWKRGWKFSVIYFNKIRHAETRLYSLIQPLTHLKSLSMDFIDSKDPAKGYLLFQKGLLEVIKKLSDKPLTEREASFVMFLRSTTKTRSSRSKSKRCSAKGGNRFSAKSAGPKCSTGTWTRLSISSRSWKNCS